MIRNIVPLDEQLLVFSRDNFSCINCGRSQFEEGVNLYTRYVTSENEGGEPVFENLLTVCFVCKERNPNG